jgi:hypothetical protein
MGQIYSRGGTTSGHSRLPSSPRELPYSKSHPSTSLMLPQNAKQPRKRQWIRGLPLKSLAELPLINPALSPAARSLFLKNHTQSLAENYSPHTALSVDPNTSTDPNTNNTSNSNTSSISIQLPRELLDPPDLQPDFEDDEEEGEDLTLWYSLVEWCSSLPLHPHSLHLFSALSNVSLNGDGVVLAWDRSEVELRILQLTCKSSEFVHRLKVETVKRGLRLKHKHAQILPTSNIDMNTNPSMNTNMNASEVDREVQSNIDPSLNLESGQSQSLTLPPLESLVSFSSLCQHPSAHHPLDFASTLLERDPMLSRLRLYFVPARINEEDFWCCYFDMVQTEIFKHVNDIRMKPEQLQDKSPYLSEQ